MLRYPSSQQWLKAVLNNFDTFLIDHAAAEKKASGMAISMLSHYPDKPTLVKAMIDLSIEEMIHFREVVKLMTKRNLILAADTKDPYVIQLRNLMRKGANAYFMDRLIVAGMIEARGCERFGIIAAALPEGELKKFYLGITQSEARHENLFIDLAKTYFSNHEVQTRLDTLLDCEAQICAALPIKPTLH